MVRLKWEIAPDSIYSRYEDSAHVIPMLHATENLESLSIVIDAVRGPCEPALDINWVFVPSYSIRTFGIRSLVFGKAYQVSHTPVRQLKESEASKHWGYLHGEPQDLFVEGNSEQMIKSFSLLRAVE